MINKLLVEKQNREAYIIAPQALNSYLPGFG
jgi:hypothetical protein